MMKERCLIGIDVGTSGVKVLVLAENGMMLASAVEEYPLYSPYPGWTEQEPEDWWQGTIKALQRVLPTCSEMEIAAVGMSGQMHGMVALDHEMQVIRRAILWNDQRTVSQCQMLTDMAGGPSGLLEMTNNQMLTGYTGGKILWLMQNEPEHYARTRLILNPKDYIRYRLTGVAVTEVSDASGTGLYDVRSRRWCQDLMQRAGISPDLFPDVLESTDAAGTVTAYAAVVTGLPAGTKVSAGGGDAVISTTGLGLVKPGRIGITLGTSGVVAMGLPCFLPNPGGSLQVFRGNARGSFTAMGVTLAAAGSYHWFRQAFGQSEQADAERLGTSAFRLLDEEAGATNPGAGGLIFLPYLTGERCPIHDAKARGGFIGLTGHHGKGHFARAVLEGVACSLRQVFDLIGDAGRSQTDAVSMDAGEIVLAGGGAVSPLWRQIFADCFQLPVRTVYGSAEGGSFGAALVAGVTAGIWSDLPEAVALVRPESEILPLSGRRAVYDELYRTYTLLYPVLKNVLP